MKIMDKMRFEARLRQRSRATTTDPSPEQWELAQTTSSAPCPRLQGGPAVDLKKRIGTAAFAFRGFDFDNLGRSPELLDHPAYGPVVLEVLAEASAICSRICGVEVDLAARIRGRQATTLEAFPQEVALILGMELAQVRLLEEFFDVPVREARLSFGYSLGELAALVLGGVFRMDQVLPIILDLARDCAELAPDTSMGVLFTRGPDLSIRDVQRLCVSISSEGHGLIGPSTYLSPNTILLLGQGDTIDRFERAMKGILPDAARLRRNPHHWPPLHTPLVRCRNVPNRTAIALYQIEGELPVPSPPIVSCVTGTASYDPFNCRDHLIDWTDHPQRLWDVISETLGTEVNLVIHTGPAPNLIPATFTRLGASVRKQVGSPTLTRLGSNVVSGMNRYAWLARLLPSRTALLRAPFIEHITLEDWLLDQPIP